MTSGYCQLIACSGNGDLPREDGDRKRERITGLVQKKKGVGEWGGALIVQVSLLVPLTEAGYQEFPYQEVLVVDAEALPEVSEHQGAVLLELEMTWHVLPLHKDKKKKTAGETLQEILGRR